MTKYLPYPELERMITDVLRASGMSAEHAATVADVLGWAVDPDDRGARLTVRILVDGVEVTTGVADSLREDLDALEAEIRSRSGSDPSMIRRFEKNRQKAPSGSGGQSREVILDAGDQVLIRFESR